MDIIYTGKEVKKMLSESISEYKPKFGDGVTPSENKKINKKSNENSLKDTKVEISKEESKPVKLDGQSTDLGNNKNMLDLQFDNDPGKDYLDRVKKQVTGEDSEFGNKSDEDDAASNKGNKAFYDAAKKASAELINNKQKLQNSGLVGKEIPLPKKSTPFKESTETKTKRLNFKNTKFLSEKHLMSLIPEDYKTNKNVFIMKDCCSDEYLIEWSIDEKTQISEGIVLKHENKTKLSEEFDRIKNLYKYKIGQKNISIKNNDKTKEDYQVISENIKKLKEVSDN